MQLIVDNGGTKALWTLIENGSIIRQETTAGMPPYFLSNEEIGKVIHSVRDRIPDGDLEIFFYSTGCRSFDNQQRFAALFEQAFPQASTIEIATDILAVARALCQKEAGIACILGTGSNSCLYDGEKVIDNRGGLGFILGDEGSGAALGKDLIKAWMEERLPPELLQSFEEKYQPDHDEITEAVYRGSAPSRFLAGYAPFLHRHREHPLIADMLTDQFRQFFIKCVQPYTGPESLPVHFSGSVALHFQEMISRTGAELKLSIAQFLAHPMEGLIRYHSTT